MLSLLTTVALDLRGSRLIIERQELMELPESVLLCLFPNGVVLSPQRQLRDESDEEDVYYVDVSAFPLFSLVATYQSALMTVTV